MKKMQKGFTLIELMIVVAIIGALTAIAVPAYKSYTKKSEAIAGVSVVRTLLTNIDMYEQENSTFPTTALMEKIGAATDMSALGLITLVAAAKDGDGAVGGTAILTFGANATLKDKIITYTKSAGGWKCTHDTGQTLKSCAASGS